MNPIAAAILKTPRDCGADVAVGEGQPLGMPLGWGGPYLGFMATGAKAYAQAPRPHRGPDGGQPGVSAASSCTLQAREQHIRREKASSQHLLQRGPVRPDGQRLYGASWGRRAWRRPHGSACPRPTIWQRPLCAIPGVSLRYPGRISSTSSSRSCPGCREVLEALEHHGILGGLPVEGGILWCATEKVCPCRAGRDRRRGEGGAEQMKLIFEKSVPGRRCSILPRLRRAGGAAAAGAAGGRSAPALPELGESGSEPPLHGAVPARPRRQLTAFIRWAPVP